MLKHILRTDFHGDTNIGLFGCSTESALFIGDEVRPKELDPITQVLDTEAYRLRAADTSLLGMFIAANSNGIIIPNILEEEEIEEFTELSEELDVNLLMIRTKETALGNMILVNDHGCVIGDGLEEVREDIEDALEVPTETATIAGLETVGSCGVVTNKGLLAHRNCSGEEMETLERVLEVEGDIGSISFGSPFVGAGILANSHGFVTSNSTTGPELQRIDEALGFI